MWLAASIAEWILYFVLADMQVQSSSLVNDHHGPILFVANHIASTDSWCALVFSILRLKRRITVLAHEKVLRFFPFLKFAGFLSVSSDPVLALRCMKEIGIRARTNTSSAIWIFPQATHFPSTSPINSFHRGVYALMRILPKDTIVVPVGFHYYVFRQPRAAMTVSVGNPVGTVSEIGARNWEEVESILEHAVENEVSSARRQAQQAAEDRIRYPFQRRR